MKVHTAFLLERIGFALITFLDLARVNNLDRITAGSRAAAGELCAKVDFDELAVMELHGDAQPVDVLARGRRA